MNARHLLLLFSFAALTACGEPTRDDIIDVAGDDEEMNAAMDEARANIDEFVAEYREQGEDFNGLLKVYFTDGESSDDGEHMWVEVTAVDLPDFEGVLLSTPGRLTSVTAGQLVEFTLDEVSDWLYVADGKAQGAYTVQLLRSRMTDEEREAHDHGYPFSFD